MFSSQSTIRVRYSETDMMGIVYHGDYAPWLEVARTDMFRQVGLTYRQLEEMGYRLPVLRLSVDFKQPALYDDEITIEVRITEKPTLRIRLEYVLRRGDDLIASAETVHAFVDKNGRPTRPPRQFTEVMGQKFGS